MRSFILRLAALMAMALCVCAQEYRATVTGTITDSSGAAISAIIGPELKARGLLFVGIDVIGDYLTEINVTSPTGAQQLKRFGGGDAAAALWDRIEAIRAG